MPTDQYGARSAVATKGKGAKKKGQREVDLRSDTVTKPSPEMREAMAYAEVGDDVFGEDPTTNKLQEMAAKMFGKEAGLFVTSGTQGNIAAALAHCQRGDEMIVGHKSHMGNAEVGSVSAFGGVQIRMVQNDERGRMDPDEVEHAIRPDNIHYPISRLIAIENTHNGCGGYPITPEDTAAVAGVAERHGLKFHIDGARIFNAAVALETPVKELAKEADTVSFCLSKGLACPIGSVVVGSHEDIEKVRRQRKALGGAMRQVGIIAAAGVVALESMVDRLAEDHANARKLAVGLSKIKGIEIHPDDLPTNLVFCWPKVKSPGEIQRRIEARGVRFLSLTYGWRLVTHYGITSDDIDYALDVFEDTFKEYGA
jgi:threonine aldolase